MVTFFKGFGDVYDVIVSGVNVGYMYKEVDGYYVFQPARLGRNGFWDVNVMRSIVAKIDELNDLWNQQVKGELCANRQ